MSYELGMHRYRPEFVKINNTLRGFVDDEHIDNKKLNMFDNLIKWSLEDQIKVINNAYLSVKEQMILFGAFTEIENSVKVLKGKLKQALRNHENPATAGLALDLMPSLIEMGPLIDTYVNNRKIGNSDRLHELTRNLYKKAKVLGFNKSPSSQLNEVGVTKRELTGFINNFRKNINSELNIEEEVNLEEV